MTEKYMFSHFNTILSKFTCDYPKSINKIKNEEDRDKMLDKCQEICDSLIHMNEKNKNDAKLDNLDVIIVSQSFYINGNYLNKLQQMDKIANLYYLSIQGYFTFAQNQYINKIINIKKIYLKCHLISILARKLNFNSINNRHLSFETNSLNASICL